MIGTATWDAKRAEDKILEGAGLQFLLTLSTSRLPWFGVAQEKARPPSTSRVA